MARYEAMACSNAAAIGSVDQARAIFRQRCLRSVCSIRMSTAESFRGGAAHGLCDRVFGVTRLSARARSLLSTCSRSTSQANGCSGRADPLAGRRRARRRLRSRRWRSRSSRTSSIVVERAIERLAPAEIAGGAVGLLVGLGIALAGQEHSVRIHLDYRTRGQLHRDRPLSHRYDFLRVSRRARRGEDPLIAAGFQRRESAQRAEARRSSTPR